jgi:hypothetical protein
MCSGLDEEMHSIENLMPCLQTEISAVLFEKVLTASDTSHLGRWVLPKVRWKTRLLLCIAIAPSYFM